MNKSFIAYAHSEYEVILSDLRQRGEHQPDVSRYKGLGSLEQRMLHQHCIDVQGRRIRQLSVNDCEALITNMRKVKS